eukprot:gene11456-11602_t
MAGLDFLGSTGSDLFMGLSNKVLQQNEFWEEESTPLETMNITASKPHLLGSFGILPPALRVQPYATDSGDVSSLSPHVASAITDGLHDLLGSVNPAPVNGAMDITMETSSPLAALSALLNRRAPGGHVRQPAASPFAGTASALQLGEETNLAAGFAAVLGMQPLLGMQSHSATSARTFLDASQQLGFHQQNCQQGETCEMGSDQIEQLRNLLLLQRFDTWAAGVGAAQQQPAASGQDGAPKGQQQWVLQQQHTTKDSAAAGRGGRVVETAAEDDDSMDLDLEQEPEGTRKGRRGRPPKVPGQFSKGYLAIKRYRQRKKNMVEDMEEQVAAKQAQLDALTAENQQLVERLRSMDGYLRMQEGQAAQGEDTAALSTRYKTYVQQCAARVVGITQSTVSADHSGWPVFPFSLEESLALWKNNSPSTSSAAGAAALDVMVGGELVMNFDSGAYEAVPAGLWATVAQQIGLQEGQKKQLLESWHLFAGGLQKLNADRQQVKGRLHAYDQQLRLATAGGPGRYAARHLSWCGDSTGLGELTALVEDLEGSLARGKMLETCVPHSSSVLKDAGLAWYTSPLPPQRNVSGALFISACRSGLPTSVVLQAAEALLDNGARRAGVFLGVRAGAIETAGLQPVCIGGGG